MCGVQPGTSFLHKSDKDDSLRKKLKLAITKLVISLCVNLWKKNMFCSRKLEYYPRPLNHNVLKNIKIMRQMCWYKKKLCVKMWLHKKSLYKHLFHESIPFFNSHTLWTETKWCTDCYCLNVILLVLSVYKSFLLALCRFSRYICGFSDSVPSSDK